MGLTEAFYALVRFTKYNYSYVIIVFSLATSSCRAYNSLSSHGSEHTLDVMCDISVVGCKGTVGVEL